MNKEVMNVDVEEIPTKEQTEYNDALKNLKYITARLRLSQEGINVDNVPKQKLEIVIKLFDEMDLIQKDFNIGIQTIQQEVENRMKEFQTSANKKYTDVQNRYKELINSIKKDEKKKKVQEYTDMSPDRIAKAEETFAKSLGIVIDNKKGGIDISEEKAKEIQKMLAEELAKSQNS